MCYLNIGSNMIRYWGSTSGVNIQKQTVKINIFLTETWNIYLVPQ